MSSLPNIPLPVWESLCKRCGECCRMPNGDHCSHYHDHACDLYPHHDGTALGGNAVCMTIIKHFFETRGDIPPQCSYRPLLESYFHIRGTR